MTDRALTRTAAAFLLVFGFLPIVNWIPGGHEAPWYAERVGEWLMDGAIVLGVGVLLAILSRRFTWLWRPGWFDPIAAAAMRVPPARQRCSAWGRSPCMR
jgi:multisubunit Na+/H+ antiporter MnhB subunit